MKVKELKRQARREFRSSYWRCVIAGAIYLSATFGTLTGALVSRYNEFSELLAMGFSIETISRIFSLIAGNITFNHILSWLLGIFLWSPLEIGARRFFIDNTLTGNAKLLDVSFSLKENYMKKVLTMLLRRILTTVGTMLFIVPGVIISYNLKLVPFLLAEYPDMKAVEILRRSRSMMKGNRLRLFRIEISFIWWNILSMFTFSIPQILYSAPMLNICYVHFYNELLEKHHS
ncbi:MAG TPA: hypothetical protein DCP98_05970 [Sphaerochaeta sp.]|nr:hypothetical protein [Sphaerochaeta sp.]